MANPQKENGYVPVANEIVEHIIKFPLNGTQLRIVMAVWRYTYGFARKEHELSVGFLLNALELNSCQYKQIAREIKNLVDMKILVEISKPSVNCSRKISFNKDYDLWIKKSRGLKSPEDKLIQSVGTKKSIESLDQKVHQERNIINKTLKKDYIVIFDYWNSKQIVVHRRLTDKIKRKISGTLDNYSLEEIKKAIDNYEQILRGPEYYWSHSWTLEEFLQRGLEKFLTDACFSNYINKQQTKEKGEQHNYDGSGSFYNKEL